MIPTKEQNPKGLHQRYHIQKIVSQEATSTEKVFRLRPVDRGAEYFVLRLDDGGSDPVHIQACRKAVLHYAELIKDHIPQLSKDLIERYSQ